MKSVLPHLAALLLALLPALAQAQAIWHCSKQTAVSEVDVTETLALAPEDMFQIASMSTDITVIGLTLRDLMDVYSGVPVRISGRPLTACFLNDNSSTSREMLDALGLNANSMAALARKSAIVRSQLQWVSNEADMLRCMTRHHPSVGYFAETRNTDEVAPCF